MCGLGGILRFDNQPVERAALEAMQRALACRGPDGSGIFAEGPVGLVHTRLAVIDRAGGAQPMTDGPLTVVFNGEIYNHRKLRRKLSDAGANFTTDHSDTEVLLHGYRRWGERLQEKLSGMYAFVIWDAEQKEMFLIRDAVGKKPLYIWHDDSRIVFASTVAAVQAGIASCSGRKLNLDRDALRQYLSFGYTESFTLSEGIRELAPLQWLRLGTNRNDTPRLSAGARRTPAGENEFVTLIEQAVETRLEADVPLGCFLSGGIDSSLIAAIAQKQLASRGQHLRTFSVSMPEAAYDEGPWAQRVADHIGAEHRVLRAEPNVESDLQLLIDTMGEPLADSSILPTYWLSKAARQHVTVALSGDGGDEMFGGYERYVALRLLAKHGWWISKAPASRLGGEQKSHSARLRRLIEAARYDNEAMRYFSMVRLFDDEQLKAIGMRPLTWPHDLSLCPQRDDLTDPADRARWWDLHHYLHADLMRKVDRASMAVALEVRSPLLDRQVVEAALATPMKTLMPGRKTKAMLRKIARRYLPVDVCKRRKMGFAVPIGQWFSGPLKPMLANWLLDAPHLESISIKRGPIEAMITEHEQSRRDHTHRLFALLSLSMWLHRRADESSSPSGRG